MQVEIIDYGMNGEGIASIDGKIVLVPNALVGEIVDISVTKDFGNYQQAQVNEVIKPSPNRQNPICPYYNKCGGCDLQHMNYGEQLKFKTLLVHKTLKKVANIDAKVNPTVGSKNILGYRNKMSFAVNQKCGFYAQNTNDVIEIDKCIIADDNINKILQIFNNYCKNNQNLIKNIKNNQNLIKNLVVRYIDGQYLIAVVAKSQIDLIPFISLLQQQINNFGVYLIINTRKDSVVLDGKVIHLFGLKYIKCKAFGVDYHVDLMAFHQTNLDIQNKLYNKVLDSVNEQEVVVNGFSGQGLLSAILATKAKQVVGIEINKNSHKSAENLKKFNKIGNLINIFGDFNKKFLDFVTDDSTVILDPSKKGCGAKVMQNLVGVNKILYVSCNPIALAKDLREIIDKYDVIDVTPFDMFPNTKNVETFVYLKRKNDGVKV